jgi:hypothetical protein
MMGLRTLHGMVTVVDAKAQELRLKEAEEQFCRVCCTEATRIVGENEETLRLGSLQAGDIVKAEVVEEGDRLHLQRLVLLRPAWREIGSFES